MSVPFVLSWSLLNALSCGCLVLAGDVAPVREVMQPGVNGLLEPLFDIERLSRGAIRALEDPAAYLPLRRAARRSIEEKYSLPVAIPLLREYFERSASDSLP